MNNLSIKRIKRLIDYEKPKAIARYLKKFLPKEKQTLAELKLDEYAHSLMKAKHIEKKEVLKKVEELAR